MMFLKNKKKRQKSKNMVKKHRKNRDISKSKKTKRHHKNNRKNKQTFPYVLAFDISVSIVISIIIFVSVCSFFLSIKTVEDNSMLPMIKNNRRVLVLKESKEIRRFDIVAFKNGSVLEFRRVIGLPGETIRFTEDNLYVDDQLTEEKFIFPKLDEYNKKGEVFTQSMQEENGFQVNNIPEKYYLLLGDNRPNSTDSRHYGLVEKDKIKGKVTYLLHPLEKIN